MGWIKVGMCDKLFNTHCLERDFVSNYNTLIFLLPETLVNIYWQWLQKYWLLDSSTHFVCKHTSSGNYLTAEVSPNEFFDQRILNLDHRLYLDRYLPCLIRRSRDRITGNSCFSLWMTDVQVVRESGKVNRILYNSYFSPLQS